MVQFPIGCTGEDSHIDNYHQCLPKPMTPTLIDENFPVDQQSSDDNGSLAQATVVNRLQKKYSYVAN
jgi:hypothetical protein